MKIFNRKMQVFYVSNIVLSFALTSFLGINYCLNEENEVLGNSEIAILDTDNDPLSQTGEVEKEKVVEVKKETKATNQKKKTVTTVTKKEVKASKTYVPAVYSEVTGQAVVDYAMKYLGLRYVSNGYSLSTGTDCSGFTKLIYKEFGVTLSRAVKAQSSNGSYVSKSDLQKGDLVFYGYGNGVVRHVGIYIGNGQVIHESNPKDGVKISSVNMMQYITARRVINSTAIKMVEDKIEAEKSNNSLDKVVLDTDNKITEEIIENKMEITEEIKEETSTNQEIVSTENKIEENLDVVEDKKEEVTNNEVETKVEDTKKVVQETVKVAEVPKEENVSIPEEILVTEETNIIENQ